MSATGRAIGFCANAGCSLAGKAVVLDRSEAAYRCEICRRAGMVKREWGAGSAPTGCYSHVRVEYNYDPMTDEYCEVASACEEGLLRNHGHYTIRSPLIHEREHALRVARGMLEKLNEAYRRKAAKRAHATSEELAAEGWDVS